MRRIVGIHDKLPILETIPLSLQHLTAMFGATILVPLLLGVNPAICLLMNGIGTIIYSFITKGGIPAYLGSSFAFIAPTLLIISSRGSFAHAQAGFIVFGLFFVIMSFIIKFVGIKWIDVVMPPAVMGSVVAVIGLELAPTAAQQAGLAASSTAVGQVVKPFIHDPNVIFVALFTLLIAILGSILFRGFLQVIPILIAVVAGYIVALAKGMVNFQPVHNAAWFAIPKFTAPVFDMTAIAIILPACLVVFAEHIGHLIVTSNITGTDLLADPGLHKSLLGDGLSNIISGFTGSTPNTTYGENIGVMAITRVYSVWVIRGAAIIAIIFSCIGKLAAVIQTIPTPVMGGITLYLYGVIGISGIRMLVEQKVDFSRNYNLVLGAITFSVGVSGASITMGTIELKGMALAAVVGVILSLLMFLLDKLGIMNEKYEPTAKFEDPVNKTDAV